MHPRLPTPQDAFSLPSITISPWMLGEASQLPPLLPAFCIP